LLNNMNLNNAIRDNLNNAIRDRPILQALAAFMLVAALLSACGDSAEADIGRAQALLDSGKIPAAVVELKNALQKEPKNLKARILLGQSYLDMFDAANAEAQLLRARTDGADAALVAKPLAQAELQLGKFDKALSDSEFPANASPALKASLYSVRARAYLGQGQAPAADEALSAGLKEDPHSVDVLAAMIQYAMSRNDLATARERLSQALVEAPDSPRVLALKGSLAFADSKFSEAEEAFAQIVKRQPWNLGARADVAQAEIAEGKLKEADANLAIVLKAAPKAPRPNYLRALTAFQAHDYATANTYIQNVLAAYAANPPALLLAGATSYALNQFEQANAYLTQYVAKVPQDVRGRRLLGAVQIRLGHPADAVKTLSPAVAAAGNDVGLLALIGEAAARSGDAVAADKYLSMAVERQPNNEALRTALGRTKVALGQTDAGIEEFEKASKQDPNALGPDTALFATYMRAKEYDKALAVAESLKSKQPTNPLGFDLAALVLLAKGDRAGAETALMKAKELRPEDRIALLTLATLAMQDGKFDVAAGYYETIVRGDPKNTQANIGLAQIQLAQGNAAAARAILEKAIGLDPDNVVPRLALARFLLVQGKPTDALSTVEPVLAKNPQQPDLLDVVGQAQLEAGQVDAGVATFKQLVDAAPKSSIAHRKLAFAYGIAHDPEKALLEAQTALQLAPEDKAAKLSLGTALISAKNLDEARRRADDWATASPQDADFAELQGLVASAQNRPEDAVAAFQRGLTAKDNKVTRIRLAQAQAKAGRPEEGEKTLRSWLDANPKDVAARAALAQLYLETKQFAPARDQFAEIVRLAPNNVSAENNLAWTMSLLGQKDDALVHARHAADAAPESSAVLDTLGVILLQNGKASEARDTLQKAAGGAPGVASIQFHLAQALAQTGDKDKAREILRGLLSKTEPFEERNQAQQLLAQLQ
jgi:putative PEP-CTERM system TPR-repeat lipoprotein